MKKTSLAQETVERILKLIMSEYRAGMQIPSENELSEKLGVGRNTVREAVRALVERNVLEIRRGNGTFVSEKKGVSNDPLGLMFIEDHKKVAQDIMQIRILLEPDIAGLAAQYGTEEEIIALEQEMLAFEEKVSLLQSPVEQDIAFHRQISRMSRNVVMPNLIPVISEAIRISTDIKDGQRIEVTMKTHRMVFDAIKRHDAIAAKDAMLLHLAYNRNKISNAAF